MIFRTFPFLVLLACSPFSWAQTPIEGYTFQEVAGFGVYVQDSAVIQDAELVAEALELLETKLTEINGFCLSADRKAALQAVPIFMDWATTEGAAVYHPNPDWLRENGYIPEKARSVEISNVRHFIDWTAQNQPYMVLHELAHAYHHRVHGFAHAGITGAFATVQEASQYQQVNYHSGGESYFIQDRAYALNNEREYFAELTEAFFGRNDYYPFHAAELAEYDPKGYAVIKEVWGFDPAEACIE